MSRAAGDVVLASGYGTTTRTTSADGEVIEINFTTVTLSSCHSWLAFTQSRLIALTLMRTNLVALTRQAVTFFGTTIVIILTQLAMSAICVALTVEAMSTVTTALIQLTIKVAAMR
jgi:hypothetical protein